MSHDIFLNRDFVNTAHFIDFNVFSGLTTTKMAGISERINEKLQEECSTEIQQIQQAE